MEKLRAHTTVNLDVNHAAMLDESAVKLRLKRTELMTLLLRRMVKNAGILKHAFSTVKYQKGGNGGSWKVVHFFPELHEYEVFTDMRNNFKFSISYLLALAIKWYLNELLSAGAKQARYEFDNYHIIWYECSEKLDNNKFCWHTIWGLSENLAKTIRQ